VRFRRRRRSQEEESGEEEKQKKERKERRVRVMPESKELDKTDDEGKDGDPSNNGEDEEEVHA